MHITYWYKSGKTTIDCPDLESSIWSIWYIIMYCVIWAARGDRVDSKSAYYAGGLPIKSWHPTSATYVECRECD